MSLINEALKKAQRQRNLESTPTASAPSGVAAAAVTTHVRAASHRSSHAPLWFGLGLLLLGGVVTAVVILFVLTPEPAPAPASATTNSGNQPAIVVLNPNPGLTATTPAPVSPAPLPAITVPSMSAPIAAAPAPAPIKAPSTPPAPPPPAQNTAPAVQVATPTPPATVAVAPPAPARPVTVAVAPPPATPAPVPVTRVSVTQEAKVYAVIDKLRITGVRGTGNEARVLMNEKVYRINDLVDRDLGLRLVEVTSSQLGFVDATGQRYKKQL
jgi:hypothetical protein